MSYQKIATVIEALSNNTAMQKISWKKTEEDSQFSVSFPNYSAIIAKDVYVDVHGHECADYSLKITNSDGEIVEEIADDDLREYIHEPWQLMKEMHDTARRQAMGVEKALDDILEQLDPDLPF